MKYFKKLAAAILSLIALSSCDIYYFLDIENKFSEGVYYWTDFYVFEYEANGGYRTYGYDIPKSIDEIDRLDELGYIEPSQTGYYTSVEYGRFVSDKRAVSDMFSHTDVITVVIFDAKTAEENLKNGKLPDSVIQKYWIKKDDVLEKDGKTYKDITFPPNEGMKDVEMEPAYGTYN